MILCCGEALIDMIRQNAKGADGGFLPHAGGAVFNTAIALGRLGEAAGMFTGLSTDLFGRFLEETLEEAGVDTGLVLRSDRPTTLAFVDLTAGAAQYHFYDENSAGRMIAPEDLPALPDDVEALFLGGISLTAEPGASAYATLADRAAGRVVMLDPNIRPDFIRDEAAYRARIERMMRVADIVKLSEEDLDWLFPGDAEDGLGQVQALGVPVVILTRGAEGALSLLPGGVRVEVPAAPAKVVDTVGAGDSFNAGVLASLSERGLLSKPALAAMTPEMMRPALVFGATVAAISVGRAGANPPWRNELAE